MCPDKSQCSPSKVSHVMLEPAKPSIVVNKAMSASTIELFHVS